MVCKWLMKSYVIDELRYPDYEKIKAHLDLHCEACSLGGIYWIPLEPTLYNNVQSSHGECSPFYIALDLTPEKLVCELLVRTKNRIRCDCISYADKAQRNWIIQLVDNMFSELCIIT